MIYNFATLDPRPGADNSAVLGADTLGIEVTIPALAAQCGLGNIDPQHSGTSSHSAAILAALDAPLPPAGATLVTMRPDLDSVGAMAVLGLRASGRGDGINRGIVDSIARADAFDHGEWPGAREIATTYSAWMLQPATSSSHPRMAPLAALCADRAEAMSDRVAAMAQAICGHGVSGLLPYIVQVKEQRMALLLSIREGATRVSNEPESPICRVTSTHRGVRDIGYHLAPVVVATNPEMRGPNGAYLKHTICQWRAGYADLRATAAALNRLEEEHGGTPGWGGSATIIGSPQGASSALTNDDVASVVRNHLC